MVRFIGCAAFGAVAVGGGAEKVFEPREPMLERGRASASAITMANTAATANSAKSGRSSFIVLSQSPVGRREYRGPTAGEKHQGGDDATHSGDDDDVSGHGSGRRSGDRAAACEGGCTTDIPAR